MTGTLLFYLLVVFAATAFAQECSDDTLRRCRRDGSSAMDSKNDCSLVRENFDCVLWQSSMCLGKEEQDSLRQTITQFWRYLKSFCETDGNWYTKSCYQKNELKRCEALLPAKGYSTDTTSCRSYSNFRDCVWSIVNMDCSSEDKRLLGTYFMEKGGQRSWNCPRSSSYSASAPLAASDTSYGDCLEYTRSDVQQCRRQFDDDQKEADGRRDYDMRHHNTCCAFVHYEECTKRALQSRCSESRSQQESRNLLADLKQRYPYTSCDDHTSTECSAASAVVLLHPWLWMGLIFWSLKQNIWK